MTCKLEGRAKDSPNGGKQGRHKVRSTKSEQMDCTRQHKKGQKMDGNCSTNGDRQTIGMLVARQQLNVMYSWAWQGITRGHCRYGNLQDTWKWMAFIMKLACGSAVL
jgi:hypothetical protein